MLLRKFSSVLLKQKNHKIICSIISQKKSWWLVISDWNFTLWFLIVFFMFPWIFHRKIFKNVEVLYRVFSYFPTFSKYHSKIFNIKVMRKNVNSLVFCDTLYAGQADTCPDCNQASHPSRPGHSANTAGFKPEKTSGSMETGNNKTRKYDPLVRIWKNYPPDPAQ